MQTSTGAVANLGNKYQSEIHIRDPFKKLNP